MATEDRWSELAVRIKDSEREARRRRLLEVWSTRAARSAIQQLFARAEVRAAELEEQSGRSIRVSYSPPADEEGSTYLSFLSLSLHGMEARIYAHHQSGRMPRLHFVLPNAEGANQRIFSLPGCYLFPTPDASFCLRPIGGSFFGALGQQLTVDDVLFRAFELLVDVATGRQRRSGITDRRSAPSK
jgi:hypothetical protein